MNILWTLPFIPAPSPLIHLDEEFISSLRSLFTSESLSILGFVGKCWVIWSGLCQSPDHMTHIRMHCVWEQAFFCTTQTLTASLAVAWAWLFIRNNTWSVRLCQSRSTSTLTPLSLKCLLHQTPYHHFGFLSVNIWLIYSKLWKPAKWFIITASRRTHIHTQHFPRSAVKSTFGYCNHYVHE